MIAKVLTLKGKTWRSFRELDDYVERFEACIGTRRGNLEVDREVPEQMDEVASRGTGRVRNPAYHFVLSWDRGGVTDRQMWATVEKALLVLGCSEHQWLAARHGDSKYEHCHVLVNRVHPRTFRAWTPQYDYVKLRGLCRQLDPRWALRERRDGPSPRAADFEVWTGQQSMQSWGREHVVRALEAALQGQRPSWRRFHAVLGEWSGATYEVDRGVGYVVDRTGGRARRIRATAIDPRLARERLEAAFGEPWSPAGYGRLPQRERGYGFGIERYELTTKALDPPIVRLMHRRFVREQREWATIGKLTAQEERRIVGRRLERDLRFGEDEADRAMMLLRSLGGTHGETSRTVLSMLVRYDRERALREAERQIAEINARRPPGLFRRWLKKRATEGDVSAGVALIRVKKQPLDGDAVAGLLGRGPDRTLEDVMALDEAEAKRIAEAVLETVRDVRSNPATSAQMADDSVSTEQDALLAGAIETILQHGREDVHAQLLDLFQKAGATKAEERVSQGALVAIAGAGVLDRKVIQGLYPKPLQDHYLPYEDLGPAYAAAVKPPERVDRARPKADHELSDREREIKTAVLAALAEKPTWAALQDALRPFGLVYGAHYRWDKKEQDNKIVGGLYDDRRYVQMPFELDLGMDKMQKRLGGFVEAGHPAATMTKAEREEKGLLEAVVSEESAARFKKMAKERYAEQGRADEETVVANQPAEAEPKAEEPQSISDVTPEAAVAGAATDREAIDEEEAEIVDEPFIEMGREPRNEEAETTFADPTLDAVHAALHREYSLYCEQFGDGIFDEQRGLFRQREDAISRKMAEDIQSASELKGQERLNAITIALAERMRSRAFLEESWARENEVLQEAWGKRPLSYAEWLRGRNDEEAKRLADEVERTERSKPRIYRGIEGDKDLLVMKNLGWQAGEKGVDFTFSGTRAWTDDGTKLGVYGKDDRVIAAALLMAYEKYGKPNGVYLNGSLAYKQQVTEIAARMGVPIANKELQDLHQRTQDRYLTERRSAAAERNRQERTDGTLEKAIAKIVADEAMDPAKANTDDERKVRAAARDHSVDEAVAAEIVRRYEAEGNKGVRLLEGDGKPVEGELAGILMFPRRQYAVVRTGEKGTFGPTKRLAVARMTQADAMAMVTQVGNEVTVLNPLTKTGQERPLEVVRVRGGGGRERGR